jgi:ABC-type amino acid transport substrate-binding protein
VEGTAQTTDIEETITNIALGAAAMRSSFELAIQKLREAGTNAASLGLAIGFEFGPMNVTQLGMKGELVRCSVSRGVLTAESEQSRCAGSETAIGATAHAKAPVAVQGLFGPTRKRTGLTYDIAVREIAESKENARKAREASGLLKFASAATVPPPFTFPDRRTAPPAKPAGFA